MMQRENPRANLPELEELGRRRRNERRLNQKVWQPESGVHAVAGWLTDSIQIPIKWKSLPADFDWIRAGQTESFTHVKYSGTVNNLETTDNTYLVSNAVVHNCSVEVGAAAGSRFDMERFGCLEAFGSLRQYDLLIVMGTVTRKLAPRLKMVYDQMAEPKYVLAVGACSITGGLYFDSYNVLRGIDDIIPVDVYIPGCPPRAEAFLQGMILLEEKIKQSNTLSGR